ncbi:sperm-associated antigen 1-like [Chironomus tepperi]|uniref:sperm-associated antigen 1-like n=1 Tax=Chironomus tepperi TaxID=113505 RepID=UPI00391F7500
MFVEDQDKPPKKTLLERYEIPVEFLDFSYIKTCNESKTLERIIKILRSGEEGYYPDLTKCAEERLSELKPNSKLFWKESAVIKTNYLDDDELKKVQNDMKNFVAEMKQQDKILSEIKPRNTNKNEPPIRAPKVVTDSSKSNKNSDRIKSTDYSKWDKFDADAAVLKIDLDDERQREIAEAKNKKNLEKTKLIEVIEDDVDELTDFEKDRLSLKFKERGNEAYKAKDYDEAIKEYTQSINIKKTAAALNNRALVYLKLKNYIRVISDANECLQIEPNNVKALLRKAQAFIGQDLIIQAYETFDKVLQIDSTNETAQQEIIKLHSKMPQRKAIRMKIEEVDETSEDVNKANNEKKKVKKGKSERLDMPESSHVPELVKNIIPEEKTIFDKFKSEDTKPREKLVMPTEPQQKRKEKKSRILIEEIN